MLSLKHWFFRNYWWIYLILFVASILFFIFNKIEGRWEAVVGVSSILISSLFFIQKQKLEELNLLKDLFIEFNKRYNKLNESLNLIVKKDKIENLTEVEINILYDYFNLCGEEYFYHKNGYIHLVVWESWLNGMKYFYKNPQIKKIWQEELKENSYYGFNQSILD